MKTWIDEMIEREAIPKTFRTETTRDFCTRHKVEERTYYNHARKKENQEEILKLCLSIARREVPEILQKLSENAKEGKEKSIEMYLKFVADVVDRLDITSKGDKIMFLPSEVMNKNELKGDE